MATASGGRRRVGGGGDRPRRGRAPRSDMAARLVVAVPALLVAAVLVAQGGVPFALGIVLLGLVALHELYALGARVRPLRLGGFLGLIALALAASLGDHFHVVLALAGLFPALFVLALLRPGRPNVSWALALTLFGVVWVGLPVVHAILLRELEHGGGLVLDVLIGTFVGDSVALAAGRAFGRRPLAPGVSPNKTVEGLVAGLVSGALAVWLFAFAYQDWFPGWEALALGVAVAAAAPVGDLFESLIKRDLAVKDTGRLFGVHGGALDRLDAVLFSIVTGYYVARALGF